MSTETKLTKAQMFGVSRAIIGFIDGSLGFKPTDPELTEARITRLRAIADRFNFTCPTKSDRVIARHFAALPYTRDENYALRWAQERAFANLWGYHAKRDAQGEFVIPANINKPIVAAEKMYTLLDRLEPTAHVAEEKVYTKYPDLVGRDAVQGPPPKPEPDPTDDPFFEAFPEANLGCDVADHINKRLQDMNDALAVCLPFSSNRDEANIDLLDVCLTRAQELVGYIPKIKKMFGQED